MNLFIFGVGTCVGYFIKGLPVSKHIDNSLYKGWKAFVSRINK